MISSKQRLENFTEMIPFHNCHEWIGYRDRNGYGRLKINGKMIRSNRLALSLKIGRELLPHEQALHRCDNPPCVNPDHLFLGSALDNMRDKISKGRMTGPCAINKSKTHCKNGHEFSEKNTYIRPSGKRCCRKCHVIQVMAATRKRRTQLSPNATVGNIASGQRP